MKLSKYETYRTITREIVLVLENTGSAPAHDINMYLDFPNGFDLREELLPTPDEPVPPAKPEPKSLIPDIFSSVPYIPNSLSSSFPNRPSYIEPPESNGLVIRKSNSYEVSNDLDKLKHYLVWDWSPLYATFHKPTKLPTAFEIDYEIIAANIPDVIPGKLVIKLIE
ncbi:MAG: hypothetical protein H6672_23190 [Anaerolineaceae bacterium]|nr:hypothetical protein [Anaerolineaceae bacterium]